MSVSTDKLIPGVLPPKEETAGTDFVKILDGFDPSPLTPKVISEFASRDPFVTLYQWEPNYYRYKDSVYPVPAEPAEKRLRIAKHISERDREDLINLIGKYVPGDEKAYLKCRRALIKAIGSKVCAFIVQNEVDRLTPAQHQQQIEDNERWERYFEEEGRYKATEQYSEWPMDYTASLSEKIVKVRKGIRRQNGRFFTQRDFAKLIGYPVSKYADAEKYEDCIDDVLLEKLIMICHANPYFLYDEECDADFAEYGGMAILMGDAPAVFCSMDVIWKWICEGKPRSTCWIDGVLFFEEEDH